MPRWSTVGMVAPETNPNDMPTDSSPLPPTWPERKEWLERRFRHLDPEVRDREIEFHKEAFEKGPSLVVLRRREVIRRVLEAKPLAQQKIFCELVERDLP